MTKAGYVYIMASRLNGTIYIGVTSDLAKRAYQHRNALIDGFTKKYGCRFLVWYEPMTNWTVRGFANANSRNGTGTGSCG